MRRLLALLILMAVPAAPLAADFTFSLLLSANPQSIVADGKSTAMIGAEVRDPDGNLVADGTLVNFSTSAGAVDSAVQTRAGVARARLRSSSTPGAAIVSASLATGGAVAQIRVDFVPEGSEFRGESHLTLVSSGYLVYHPGERIVEAMDGIRIYHRGLTIEAASAQVDLGRAVVRARHRVGGTPVTISRGGKVVQASQLYYGLSDMQGQLVTTTNDKVERLSLNGRDLSTSSENLGDTKMLDFVSLEESEMVVMAKAMTIKPGEEIHLRQARVYVGDTKVISLPLHVIPLRPSGGSRRLITLTSSGVRLDIPIYYSLTPNSTGSFQVRHQRQAGWGYYGAQPGWSLDLVQDYTFGGDARGSLGIDRILGGEWGAHWSHEQQFGNATRLYSYFDYPAHRDLFGSMSLSHSLKNSVLGMSLYASQVRSGNDSVSGDLYIQSRPKPLVGKYADYSISARTTYSSYTGTDGDKMGFGVQGQLLGRTLKLTPSTNFRASATVGHDWGGRSNGLTGYATASLFQRLGQTSSLGLTYSYTRDPGIISTLGRHSLNATGYLNGSSPWSASFFSTIGLDGDLFSSFGDVYYQLRPDLRLGVIGTYQQFGGADYGDLELAVGKKIWNQEFLVVYSLDRKAFRLELAGFNF